MTAPTRIELPMPRLGETMDQGTITNWLVELGATFKRGDGLLELETDKTVAEYPALGDGVLVETLVAPGDVVEVGAPIAVIEVTELWAVQEEADAPKPDAPVSKVAAPSPSDIMAPPAQALRATPVARRLARKSGISLDTVQGTGRRGRIEAQDVLAATKASSQLSPPRVGTAQAPFLFIHGFGGTGTNWAAVRAGLQRAGHTSTAPDMPGHGQNASDATGIDDLVHWLTAMLAEANEPVHLVGHSLGAHICAVVASHSPKHVARLSLIAPAGCGAEINGAFIQGLAGATSPGGLAHLMRLLGPKAAALDSTVLAAMAAELQRGRLIALADDMAQGDRQQIDTIGPLRQISQSIPVQALFGMADTIIPKTHIFNLPPQVACHVLRSGHMPHWDTPGLVERLLTNQN